MNREDKQIVTTMAMVVGTLIAMAFIFFLVAKLIVTGDATKPQPVVANIEDGSIQVLTADDIINERIRPVGHVVVSDPAKLAASSAPKSAADIYNGVCSACHKTGVADAPILGEAAAWTARYATGMDTLVDSVTNGKGAMPPKGGAADLSAADIKSVVAYMLKESGQDVAVSEGSTSAAAEPKTAEPVANNSDIDGAAIYNKGCMACHAAGVAGAPKLGDQAAWQPRIGAGIAALSAAVMNGKGAMPPKGAIPSLTEAEANAAVEYMVKEAGLDLSAATATEAMPVESVSDTAKAAVAAVTATVATAVAGVTNTVTEAVTETVATSVATSKEAVAKTVAAVKSAEPATTDHSEGMGIYKQACFACHDSGVAGAPKIGDTAAWSSRIAGGAETLYATAINGKGAMPPKGGRISLSDDEIKVTVDYMISASQ